MGLAAALAVVAAGVLVSGLGGGSPAERGETPLASSSGSNGGPTDEIIADLQQRLEEDPEDFRSHIDLANAYLQKARENGDPSLYPRAEELLERAGEIEPQDPELLATRGVLALARHEFAGALELGEEALASNPDSARYYGIVGDAQIELGRYEEAVGSYQEMVDHRPDFESYIRVSHARELYGDPEGAMEAMQAALDAGVSVSENAAWAHVQLGNLRFTSGDLDGAAREYDRSLMTFAEYPLALAGQARVAAARGEMEEAATLYEQAFDRMPLPEHAIALGDVYAEMGDQERAEEQYEVVRAIDTLFRDAGVDTDLEIALFFADHDIELQTSLEKARSAYEARPSIHAADVLAWTLYKTGDYEEAQRYASEALELGTRDPLKLFHAGMIARELGQDEQAREYLQRATGLNPHFSPLYDEQAAAELEELEEEAASSGGEE
ncbi:MAG: tetratricopeptide repeat protein [Rubrobacter sp.]|nr:tetratricopeptide repeat protein [Rubrobacter sp.]